MYSVKSLPDLTSSQAGVKSVRNLIPSPVKETQHMVSAKTFREMAMAFEYATEEPHFEKTSFRVNKKIFATLDERNATATLKLNEIDQSVFCAFDITIFYPANGAWGKQGWTIVDLSKARKTMLGDALKKSYLNVSVKK